MASDAASRSSLASLGYDLILGYRSDEAAMHRTIAECLAKSGCVRVEQVRGDIADAGSREELIARAQSSFGRLDLLVNNAGMAPRDRVHVLNTTEASFDEVLGTNLKGPFFLTQLGARYMIQCRETLGANYYPKIITISSVSAYAASSNRAEYCISKAGLSMVTAVFASALARHGIGVFEIRPGVIATDMTAGVKAKSMF